MNSLTIDGVHFVKASDAAKRFGYTADYIGQLVRAGKISGQQIGRTWYVREDELTGHKQTKGRSNKQKTQEALHRAIAQTPHAIYNGLMVPNAPGLIPEYRKRLLDSQIRYEPDAAPLRPEGLASDSYDSPREREVPVVVPEEEFVQVEKLGKTLSITKIEPAAAVLEAGEVIEPPMRGSLHLENLEAVAHERPYEEMTEEAPRRVPEIVESHRIPTAFEERLHAYDQRSAVRKEEASAVPVELSFIPAKPAPRRTLALGPRFSTALLPLALLLSIAFTCSSLFLEKVIVYERGAVQKTVNVTNMATVIESLSRVDEI